MRPMSSWETPWVPFTSYVIVLWMLSLTVSGNTLGASSNSSPKLPLELPCPDPEVVAPCKCTFNATLGMDMDCSNVMSEDELRRIFSNDFAFTEFRKFNISNNNNIQSLREGDLGSASFTEMDIVYTSLSEIEYGALKGSLHTLVTLNLYDNKLKFVHDLSAFTRLKYLRVYDNRMYQFPIESSATLMHINFDNNYIDDVPEDAVTKITPLEYLSLYGNSLTDIHPHTFTRNEYLNHIDLGGNKLTTIPDDAITLHGPFGTYLRLSGNQISGLTYEAVSSVTDWLDVSYNNLTEVPEKVFRPFLEDSVDVIINGNPFKCGCDMAWLVLNQTLLNKVYGVEYTKCSDGKKFTELDPEAYKVMCPNATAVPL